MTENLSWPAQIARIRAEARDQALEDAASVHDDFAADEMELSAKYRSGSNPWFAHIQRAKMHGEDAAIIRAMKGAKP